MSDVTTSWWTIEHCLDVTRWSSKFDFIFRDRLERHCADARQQLRVAHKIRHEHDVSLSLRRCQ